jgi:cyclic pyranopterin phosphate synthase
MPADGIVLRSRGEILTFEQILRVVRAAVALGIRKVRLTGGEPLVRKGVTELVARLREIGGMKELCMTTNGILLDTLALPLKKAGLDRLNISLDTVNAEKYQYLTRGGDLARVKKGIQSALLAGFQNTKINMVLIPGFNDDEVLEMQAYCRRLGVALQRINRYSLCDIHRVPTDTTAERPLDCSQCNRLRLLSDGRLKPCLFSDIEIPVDWQDIEGSIRRTLKAKPRQGAGNTTRENWQIGG